MILLEDHSLSLSATPHPYLEELFTFENHVLSTKLWALKKVSLIRDGRCNSFLHHYVTTGIEQQCWMWCITVVANSNIF